MPIARIVAQHRDAYELDTELGPRSAVISGSLRHEARSALDLPVVGDVVLVELTPDGTCRIDSVEPRRTLLVRKEVDSDAAQPIAANLDEAWILTALDRDLNPRRLERYFAAIWDSGATPVVVLTKCDLVDDRAGALAEISDVTAAVDVHFVSTVTGEGLDVLAARRRAGMTVALVGSSGVGKSTLVNCWRTPQLERRSVSANERGRHTTTARHLYALDDGSFVIDTPGMRELGLFGADEGLEATFPEIAELAASCRYQDCAHASEPGCAVRAAAEAGRIEPERFDAWTKLQAEDAALLRRTDPDAMRAYKSEMKSRQRALRAHLRTKR